MVIGFMLATAAPAAFAQGEGFDQGVGGSDQQPGQTGKAQSSTSTPPQGKPGSIQRSESGSKNDPSDNGTGFGKRVEAQEG
jgi:hypothetical protein